MRWKLQDNNFEQMTDAGSNAANAAGRAIFGGDDQSAADGPASIAAGYGRAGMAANSPEAKAQRDADRKQRDADRPRRP
jgi:hypothetical protein